MSLVFRYIFILLAQALQDKILLLPYHNICSFILGVPQVITLYVGSFLFLGKLPSQFLTANPHCSLPTLVVYHQAPGACNQCELLTKRQLNSTILLQGALCT